MNNVVSIVVHSIQIAVFVLMFPLVIYRWLRGTSVSEIWESTLVIVIDILYFVILLVISPFILYRMYTKKKYWGTLKERLGWISHLPEKKNTIWIHGVSVGEIKSAWELIQNLKKVLPEREIIVSATSTAGKRVARDIYPDCLVIPYPLDFSWVISRYIRRFNPSLVILVELEIWPNFLQKMYQAKIPVVLVNGRLSQRSFQGYYYYLRNFFPWMTRAICRFAIQNDLYFERFLKIGIEKEKLQVTGNMKFDAINPVKWMAEKERICRNLSIAPHFKVVVMGSSHAQEEEILLSCYQKFVDNFPEVRAIIVPRHPDRTEEIARLVRQYGFIPVKKSSIENGEFHFDSGYIVIGDIMGELATIYTVAYVTIIGGSFIPHGGQNFVEPASIEKAVICGPFMNNFPEIAMFLEQKALLQLKSSDEFYDAMVDLLRFPDKVQEIGARAQRLIKQSQGSSWRNCQLCLEALEGH